MTIASTTDNDADALRTLIRRVLYSVHTSMPGVVKSFKEVGGFLVAEVQPVIQQIDTLDGVTEFRNIDPIPNVPVCIPRSQGLGLSVTIPIQVGDEGVIHFAERGLDNWLEKGGVQPPAEPVQPRSHDLSDAIFVPGIMNKPTPIAAYSTDSIEVRNEDGTVALEVSPTSVAMRAGAESISLPGDGNIYISGNIIQTGDHTASGTVTGVTDVVTGAGISLNTHKTSGVTPGAGISGVPVP